MRKYIIIAISISLILGIGSFLINKNRENHEGGHEAILYFYSENCLYCIELERYEIWENFVLENNVKYIDFGELDRTERKEYMEEYKFNSIPTIYIFDDEFGYRGISGLENILERIGLESKS